MIRTIKLEYLRYLVETVAVINSDGEYEIKPTKYCKAGEKVWIINEDNTFVETSIY